MTLFEYIFAEKFDYASVGLEDPVDLCKRYYPTGTKYYCVTDKDDPHVVVGYVDDIIDGNTYTLIVTKVYSERKGRFIYETDTANSFLYQQQFFILAGETKKVNSEIVKIFKKFKQ